MPGTVPAPLAFPSAERRERAACNPASEMTNAPSPQVSGTTRFCTERVLDSQTCPILYVFLPRAPYSDFLLFVSSTALYTQCESLTPDHQYLARVLFEKFNGITGCVTSHQQAKVYSEQREKALALTLLQHNGVFNDYCC